MQTRCGMRCSNIDEPCSLKCTRCLLHYHPACVNMHVHLKIVGYVCLVSDHFNFHYYYFFIYKTVYSIF
jgi:hypothetical protein